MHRFYLKASCFSGDNDVIWDQKESRHICSVLRLRSNQHVMAFDGNGAEYDIQLCDVRPERVTGKIICCRKVDREIPVYLELVQSVAKADKMDWIIQKSVEVGICAIRPVLTQYTVVKLDSKKCESRRQRWESIARETCKQCRRNQLPDVYPIEMWEDFLRRLDPRRLYVLFYEAEPHSLSLRKLLQREEERIRAFGISIFIGPEGGWSEAEIETASRHGIHIVRLGPRILRTETAGLVAASAILYDMGALE